MLRTINRRVSEHTAAVAYLRLDSTLALTAAVLNRLPVHNADLRTLRGELTDLGYSVRSVR